MKTERIRIFPIPVYRSVLENGLTVITANTKSRTAYTSLTFQAGALDEKHHHGVAHFLEHVLCEGRGSDGIHPAIQPLLRKGVQTNGHTGWQHTSYDIKGFSTILPQMIGALLHIGFDEQLDPDVVEKEREIIQREIDFVGQKENFIRFFQMGIHKLARMESEVIGTKKSVKAIKINDLRQFMERSYHPSRALLVIVGDLQHRDVLKTVNAFSGFPHRAAIARTLPEADNPKIRRGGETRDGIDDSVLLYWKYPELHDPGALVRYEATNRLLLSTSGGLLFQELRQHRKAVYTIVHRESRYPNYSFLQVESPPYAWNAVESETLKQIERLQKGEYADELLEMVRQHLLLEETTALDCREPENLAEQISARWRKDYFSDLLAKIPSITKDDIANAAQTHFPRDQYGVLHRYRKRSDD